VNVSSLAPSPIKSVRQRQLSQSVNQLGGNNALVVKQRLKRVREQLDA